VDAYGVLSTSPIFGTVGADASGGPYVASIFSGAQEADGGPFAGTYFGTPDAPQDDIPDAPYDPAYQGLIPPGCTANYCPVTVTATPPPDVVLLAAPFYPGMNGPLQAMQQAARGVPKTSPPPPLSPGNKPPPKFPEDFQSDWTKLLVGFFDALGDTLTDIIVVVDPCITNPRLMCGPNAPPGS
jgi:hypothetical protein